MAMENGPVEDVFPIENGDFHCHVSLLEGKLNMTGLKNHHFEYSTSSRRFLNPSSDPCMVYLHLKININQVVGKHTIDGSYG